MTIETLEQIHRPPHLEASDFDDAERLYNDTTTWLAEVMDGQMRTAFEYRFDGRELYGSDGGALKPIFDTAIVDADRMAKRNPSLAFEPRRRRTEKAEYNDMLAMERGELANTMVVVSDFPAELKTAKNDEGGYNVTRQQTMLRVITKKPDGTLVMRSQSLDRSDRDSLEAIYGYLGHTPAHGELLGQRMHVELPEHEQEFLIDWLVGVYDRSLQAKLGGQWYAGRTPAEVLNTYDFVRSQTDLIQTYIGQVTAKGQSGNLRYGLAAAMSARMKDKAHGTYEFTTYYVPEQVLEEMGRAGNNARGAGVTFSGCGDTLGPDVLQGTQGELGELGFGNNAGSDKFGSLNFKCPKGHENTRPRNRLIPRCKTCGTSVKC